VAKGFEPDHFCIECVIAARVPTGIISTDFGIELFSTVAGRIFEEPQIAQCLQAGSVPLNDEEFNNLTSQNQTDKALNRPALLHFKLMALTRFAQRAHSLLRARARLSLCKTHQWLCTLLRSSCDGVRQNMRSWGGLIGFGFSIALH